MFRRTWPQLSVAQRNACISHQPAPLRPLHRAPAKLLLKLLFAHPRQPLQSRLEQNLPIGKLPWFKIRQICYRRFSVIRANLLANVAPIYMPPDLLAKLLWNIAPQFNGQVRNAAPCIQNIRLHQRACRASVQTLPATSAKIPRRRFTPRQRRRQLQRSDNRTQKKPRSPLLIQQQRVLSQPTQSRIFREYPFRNRPRVRISPRTVRPRKSFDERILKSIEPLPQNLMVVASPGVSRNPASWLAVPRRGSRLTRMGMRCVVVQRTNNHAARPGKHMPRLTPPRVGKITHLPAVPTRKPLLESGVFRKFVCRHNPAHRKAKPARLLNDPRRVSR